MRIGEIKKVKRKRKKTLMVVKYKVFVKLGIESASFNKWNPIQLAKWLS